MNLFFEQMEQEAISRIQRFAKIAEKMGLDIAVGFSGGKDSQVVYDLCQRSGIRFTAYFNRSFESPTTLRFIREHYPDVVWRRDYKVGFIENIRKHGFLPTVQKAYCCDNYKHNPKYVDKCSIVGVRREESSKRRSRTAISMKNKTVMKQNGATVSEYFREECQSVGTKSIIQLLPIVEWSGKEVWEYIYRHQLPVNPEYDQATRVGCIVCPKSNFTRNFDALCRYPKLVDAFILALERSRDTPPHNRRNRTSHSTGSSRQTEDATPTTKCTSSAAGLTTASCRSRRSRSSCMRSSEIFMMRRRAGDKFVSF